MTVAKPLAASALIVGGMAVASALAWPHLPPGLPTHFGLDGRTDRFGSRAEAAMVTPVLAAAVALMFAALPRVMPARGRLERSAGPWAAVSVALLLFLALVHSLILAGGLGLQIDPARVVTVGLGLLLAVIGNLMGKIRYNYVFGVRTPWTLADERVWDRTHRAAGPWMMAWGALVALGALWGGVALVWCLAAGGIGLALFCLAFSYLTARRLGAV